MATPLDVLLDLSLDIPFRNLKMLRPKKHSFMPMNGSVGEHEQDLGGEGVGSICAAAIFRLRRHIACEKKSISEELTFVSIAAIDKLHTVNTTHLLNECVWQEVKRIVTLRLVIGRFK